MQGSARMLWGLRSQNIHMARDQQQRSEAMWGMAIGRWVSVLTRRVTDGERQIDQVG